MSALARCSWCTKPIRRGQWNRREGGRIYHAPPLGKSCYVDMIADRMRNNPSTEKGIEGLRLGR